MTTPSKATPMKIPRMTPAIIATSKPKNEANSENNIPVTYSLCLMLDKSQMADRQ